MSSDWINSPTAQMIVNHLASQRPAWLWSGDGEYLIWRNSAARLFRAKQKKHTVKMAKDAVPIKGQVRRLMRLGSVGLSSLARVRFLAGQKPVSATCMCTPLQLEDSDLALLIVGVDEIEKSLNDSLQMPDPLPSGFLPENGEHVFVDANGLAIAGSANALGQWGSSPLPRMKRWHIALTTPNGDFGLAVPDAHVADQPMIGEEPVPEAEAKVLKPEATKEKQLSSLLDQLANGSALFEPLDVGEDELTPAPVKHPITASISSIIEETDDTPAEEENTAFTEEVSSEATSQWRVTGRGFVVSQSVQVSEPDVEQVADELPEDQAEPAGDGSQTDENTEAETTEAKNDSSQAQRKEVDRIARYNFDELARILGNRVGKENNPTISEADKTPVVEKKLKPVAETINLSEELLVLNRLPIGILIFRDQSILFANRALADIMGSPSISRLRDSGLEAIFPRVESDAATLGPVATLLDINGGEVPVSARLQTIQWQGGSALMLSAQRKTPTNDQEEIVQAFVRAQAAATEEGYFETDAAGIIQTVSRECERQFGQDKEALVGRPLLNLVAKSEQSALREFLAQPAKFAETERPLLRIMGVKKHLEIHMLTRGNAGIVSGYFGTIRTTSSSPISTADSIDTLTDTKLLGRLSRGIRRPLNTIIGFSDLVHFQAFGKLENQRYAEYARDIKTAGSEIAQLVDEIDEYVRLEDENHVAETAEFGLSDLLEECLRLVRRQAGQRQVFVRSAISETLSDISADRATMRQAILNLLASAIDQTPAGGKVILSAQTELDGSIDIHVRDSSVGREEPSERFVVFREGNSRRGEAMVPMKSSIGLALTRSLLAVNDCSLSIDPSGGTGTLMTLAIPADISVKQG